MNSAEDKKLDHLGEQVMLLHKSVERLDDNLTLLNKLLTGNGEPAKGVLIRLDRLEVNEGRRQKLLNAVIGCSVTAIFGFIGLIVKMVMGK